MNPHGPKNQQIFTRHWRADSLFITKILDQLLDFLLSAFRLGLPPTASLPPNATTSLRDVKPIAGECWRLGLPSKPVRLAKFFLIAPVESLHLSNFFLRLNWLRVSYFFISFSEFESFHFFDFSKKAQILFFKSVASTNSAISPLKDIQSAFQEPSPKDIAKRLAGKRIGPQVNVGIFQHFAEKGE